MLLQTVYFSFSIKLKKADCVVLSIFCCLFNPKLYSNASVPSGVLMAIQTVPTGFSAVPPSGPAMPDPLGCIAAR